MKRILCTIALCVSVTGCVSTAEHNKVLNQNEYLGNQVMYKNQQIAALKAELNAGKVAVDTAQTTEKLYLEWIEQLESQISTGPTAGVTTIKNTDGSYTLRVDSTLLFDTGSITISEEGLNALNDITTRLKEVPGTIRVEGHTDNQPVRSHKVKAYAKDNWELSVKRSLSVMRQLLNNGFPPEKLSVSGYGEFHPVAANNKDSRHLNRRVDIVFVPDVPEGMDMTDASTTVATPEETTEDLSTTEDTTQKPEESQTHND